jgi:hypothetical protein
VIGILSSAPVPPRGAEWRVSKGAVRERVSLLVRERTPFDRLRTGFDMPSVPLALHSGLLRMLKRFIIADLETMA